MKFRITLVLLALVMPTVSNALGLGKLELQSGLNQPFKARVELLSATVDELDSLKISLADDEAFERAGIRRTFLLSRLRFAVQEFDGGSDYIQIRTNEAIREPFLNFLLEINWSRGRLYREYTVLFDPPIYPASDDKKQAVLHPQTSAVDKGMGDNQVVDEPRVGVAARSTPDYAASGLANYSGGDYGPAVTGDTLWSIAKAVRPDSSISIQQMMLAILSANPEAFIENNINGLKRGAVLQIPNESEVSSLAQVHALAQVRSQNALWDEYKGRVASSNVPARVQGAGAPGSETEAVPETETVDIESEPTVMDVEETSEAKLRLISESDQGSVSDQSSAEPSSADMDSLHSELVLANESIATLSMENAELKDKLTETEGIIDDLKRLIVLKEDELAAMQEQIIIATVEAAVEQDSTDATVTETDTKEVTEVTEEVIDETVEEDAVEEPKGVDEVVVEDVDGAASDGALSGFMGLVGIAKDSVMGLVGIAKDSVMDLVGIAKDSVMGLLGIAKDYLMIIAGIVGGLVLFVLAMLFVSKRRAAKAEVIADLPSEDIVESEAVTVIPGSEDDTVLPEDDIDAAGGEDTFRTSDIPGESGTPGGEDDMISPEGDAEDVFEIPDIPEESSPETVAEEDDPMEEVNVFLAYEYFDEAESFVRNALKEEPDNLNFHCKLLEVFYASGNKASYEEAARTVHEKTDGEGAHWDMTTAMWQEMSPNRALFDTPVAGEDEEAAANADTLSVAGGEDDNILDVTAVAGMDSTLSVQSDGGNELLDITFDATSGEEATASTDTLGITGGEEEDILDVTAVADTDSTLSILSDGGDELLDISLDKTSGAEATVGMDTLSMTDGEDGDALDMTAVSDTDSTLSAQSDGGDELLDISLDEVSGAEATVGMDTLSMTDGEDGDALDMTAVSDTDSTLSAQSDGGDELLDISLDEVSGAEATVGMDTLSMTDGEDGDALDMTAVSDTDSTLSAQSDGGDELLDISLDEVSGAEATVGMDTLSITGGGEDEDALDVTVVPDTDSTLSAQSDGDDELLDISLDEIAGEEVVKEKSGGMDTDDSTEGESDGLDFDLALDDDANEFANLELDDSKRDNDSGLDILDSSTGSDADMDMDMDMESTVQMPAESADSLTMAEIESDKTLQMPKSDRADKQSYDEEMASQLDLAKAYIELGDTDNAKTILEEILTKGSDSYRKQAEELIGQIG